MDILSLQGLTKRYPAFTLDHAGFTVRQGEIMGLIGRNGAGKSTTLKCLTGFVHPDEVDIRFFGMEILDFFDFISNSVLMPIVALLTCIVIGWIVTPKSLIEEIKLNSPFKAEKAWVIVIKFVAPILVIIILIWNIIGILG